MSEGTKRNISVVKDADGNKIVVINDIIFKGKKIAWDDVEKYLRKYVGEVYSIAEDKEIVFIGTELPGEYAGSVYTKKLRGMNAKAKANAVQILPEMIEIASNGVLHLAWESTNPMCAMCFITICRRVWNIIIRKLAVPGAMGKKRSACYFSQNRIS